MRFATASLWLQLRLPSIPDSGLPSKHFPGEMVPGSGQVPDSTLHSFLKVFILFITCLTMPVLAVAYGIFEIGTFRGSM